MRQQRARSKDAHAAKYQLLRTLVAERLRADGAERFVCRPVRKRLSDRVRREQWNFAALGVGDREAKLHVSESASGVKQIGAVPGKMDRVVAERL